MSVETYLEEDVKELVTNPEDLDKWKELIEQCGLEGQKTLASKDKSPIPFPQMTDQMTLVYSTLCPIVHSAEEYAGTTIPLRVLSLIHLSKQENYFERVEVWADDKNPDPIVVGTKKDSNQTWRETRYIIGRWGDELRSFPELLNLAIERKKKQMRADGNTKLAELTGKMSNLDNLIENWFYNGNQVWL